jgi:hypothetical protein
MGMKIVVASDDFHNTLSGNELRGVIHSVFENVINISMEQHLYTLANPSVGIGPRTALFEQNWNLRAVGFEQGQEVVFEDERLKCVSNGKEIMYHPLRIWDSSPILSYKPLSKHEIQRNLDSFAKIIFDRGDLDSISPLLHVISRQYVWEDLFSKTTRAYADLHMLFIEKRMERLVKVVSKRKWYEVSEAVRDVVGFGPGLTPSTDDLIVGMMLAVLYTATDKQEMSLVLPRFISAIGNRTTDISKTVLENAALGKTTEDIRNLLLSIVDADAPRGLDVAASRVMAIGKTSGTDLMTGIYIGLKLNMKKENDLDGHEI